MRAVVCSALALAVGACNALLGLDGVTLDDGGAAPDDGRLPEDGRAPDAEVPRVPTRVPVCASPRALAIVSADDSSDLDLLTTCSGGVGVTLNNGLRSYGSTAMITFDGAAALATGDLNHDGWGDLVVSNQLTIGLYTGNGSGGFAYFDGATMSGVSALALGDLSNSDGFLDVAAAIPTGVLLYPGSTGGIGNPFPITQAANGVAVLDLDGDERADLAIPANDDTLNVRRQSTGYAGETAQEVGGGVLAVGDLIAGGGDDLVVATIATAQIALVHASGTDLASGPPTTLPARASGLATGDLDRDGLADVAAICVDQPVLALFENASDRSLTPSATIPLDAVPADVAIADLDGDLRDDVAITMPTLGEVWIFWGAP